MFLYVRITSPFLDVLDKLCPEVDDEDLLVTMKRNYVSHKKELHGNACWDKIFLKKRIALPPKIKSKMKDVYYTSRLIVEKQYIHKN